jgi:hypothetical protein
MRTKEELIEFLERVVGLEYCEITEGENGKVDIKPYRVANSTSDNRLGYSGQIKYKEIVIEEFHNSDRDTIKTIVDVMNHAYAQSIKDCLAGDPDLMNTYTMSRFKFQ